LRILHITEASAAGTLQVVRTLATAQAASGHDVTLAYADRPDTPDDLSQLAAAAVEPIALPWARRSPLSNLAAGRALRRIVRERRPGVVHLHSSFAGVVGALALPRSACLIYTPHGFAFARSGISRATGTAVRAVERLVVRRCAVVAGVSEAEAALARDGLHARRVVVVRNGIPELDEAVSAGPARPEPVVLAMGRITEARRPAATARILAALAPSARVGWVGAAADGDDAPVRDAGIPVSGWLPREQVLERLAEATVYVHWSEWDGQSLAILEALACDVVVIASDIPANREVLGPRQVCADEADAIALAQAVLGDGALRAELLEDQRRRAPAFSARRMAAEWLATYQRTLSTDVHGRVHATTAPLVAPKIGDPWT